MKSPKTFMARVLMILGVVSFASCNGSLDSTKTVSAQPPPEKTCDGVALGATELKACPAGETGQILNVCTENGWELASNSCISQCDIDAQSKVSFNQDIKPIIVSKCLSCHASPERYDVYDVAKRLGGEMIFRINLPANDLERMPQEPRPELSIAAKNAFEQWRDDGYLEKNACADRDGSGGEFLHLDLNYIERHILNDLNRLDSNSQLNSRYLVISHKYNSKSRSDQMAQFRKGLNKAVNSTSTENEIYALTPVDARQTIYRVDLEAYDFQLDGPLDDRDDWDAVLAQDPFQLESFTNEGVQIKALTGVNIPWMHGDNYVFSSQDDPETYYEMLDIPATRDELFVQLGVDYQADFDNFDILFAGFFGSPISLNKNRMISRNDSDEGYFWFTYDPDDIQTPERNFFEFPLVAESNGDKIAVVDASEAIWLMDNGMQGYALFNGAGNRENEAPITVVTDIESPFNPVIKNGISCHRCHSVGLLAAADQIRDHVEANASEFTANDAELVRAYFKPNGALQATFVSDNREYAQALEKLGISPNDPDPLNYLTDDHRRDFRLEDAAAFVFFTPDEFKNCINSSNALKAQIGQLLRGGSVGLVQFQTSFPNIIVDCRLGQDPVNQ